MELIIFDVCGTLYHSNTTLDFLDYYFINNKKYRLEKKILLSIPVKLLNKVILRVFYFDYIRYRLISYLRNENVQEIREICKKFIDEQLSDKKINEVHKLLNYYKKKGSKIILVSASLDLVIEEIAKANNIKDFYATKLEIKGDFLTGRLIEDLLFTKHKKIEKIMRNYNQIFVVTDNKTDRFLLESADMKIIVSNKKNIKYWNKIFQEHQVVFIHI